MKHGDNYDLTVGGSRQRILNSDFYSPSEIFCFDEKVASFQPALLINKSFELKSKINQIIRHAFEGGLFVKWDRKIHIKKDEINIEGVYAISMREFSPLFVFLTGVGNLLALLSFFAERFTFQKMKQRTASPIWKLLARFCDGKRYYLKNLTDKLFKDVSLASKSK